MFAKDRRVMFARENLVMFAKKGDLARLDTKPVADFVCQVCVAAPTEHLRRGAFEISSLSITFLKTDTAKVPHSIED